jgi:hypothetical protein
LSLAGGGIVAGPPDYLAPLKLFGESVQLARKSLQSRVKNPLYRFDALDAITPVDIKLVTTKPLTPGSSTTVRAVITNWTDMMITGKIALMTPSGWKVSSASSVKVPPFGKGFEAKFVVTIPKTAKADANLRADADFMVEGITVKLQGKLDKQQGI